MRKTVKRIVWKILRTCLLCLVGLTALALLVLHIVLTPVTLRHLAEKAAEEYVEGEMAFSGIRAHFLRSFPRLDVEVTDFTLTYPHARYARFYQEDSLLRANGGRRRRFDLNRLGVQQGVENGVDTLASFGRLRLAVDYIALLRGEYHIHHATLEHPRIFAHYFDSTAANWDILPLSDTAEDTTQKESAPLPPIAIHEIRLTHQPFIVFTDPQDTLDGLFTMRRMVMEGKLHSKHTKKSHAKLTIDSLFLSGRLPTDTVAFSLEKLRAHVSPKEMDLEADARVFLATRYYGRLRLPLHIRLDSDFPQRTDAELHWHVNELQVGLASILLTAKGSLCKGDEGMNLDWEAGIRDCDLNTLVTEFENNFPLLKKITTQAKISLDAQVKGIFSENHLPGVDARLSIPEALLCERGTKQPGRIAVDARVRMDTTTGKTQVQLKRFLVEANGARIDLSARVEDALGKDPLLHVDGKLRLHADSLSRSAYGKELGLQGQGTLTAALRGTARQSQLDATQIGLADIEGTLGGEDIILSSTKDSLDAYLRKISLTLAAKKNEIDKTLPPDARVLAFKGEMDTLRLAYKGMSVEGKDIQLLLHNSAEVLRSRGTEMVPIMGLLTMGRLRMKDADGTSVSLRKNRETFRIRPADGKYPTPRMTLTSTSERIRLRSGGNFARLRDFSFRVSAMRHQRRPGLRERMEHLKDSLQRLYPDTPRDSLLRMHYRMRRMRETQADDLADADIKFSLSDAMARYMREWDVDGSLRLARVRMGMPSFPLKTQVTDVEGTFNNNAVQIKKMALQAGASDLGMQVQVDGLRRALAGRGGKLKVSAKVESRFIDANELLRGLAYYSAYQPTTQYDKLSDDALEQNADKLELPEAEEGTAKLVVVPGNVDVDLDIDANKIRYDSLLVDKADALLSMRGRTLQVTRANATSNMGGIHFEGFYATRARDDVKAGFDLTLSRITAQKVITLFPSVDTVMPMLTSFGGLLDCNLTATSSIDTCMNLIPSTIEGVMKISGKNLVVEGGKEFAKLASLLKFNNRKRALVDSMSVSGIVRDNVLEVFPFVVGVDRYLLAASGVQNLNKQFEYHVSVIRSPMPFKFGVNVWGKDFDDVHYGLRKALYKSADVPVYTRQLHDIQYNLVTSIRNIFEVGVEKAMAGNNAQHKMFYTQPQEAILPFAAETPEQAAFMEQAAQQGVDTLKTKATGQ